MNIRGQTQYSKTVAGLRQPKTKFEEQDFKLVFVYPILLADKLPNYSQVDNLIRDFLSITFLKEIFIENAINIVSLANQIRPITDESGVQVNPFSVVAQAMASQAGFGSSYGYGTEAAAPNYPVSSAYKQELQQKIKEKTAIIQKYTQTDPALSKLRPYIEIITMGNLIDVPVIVGTKCFQVDTLTLLHILIAAISLNLPNGLSSSANLDRICTELNNLDKSKYWRLLNNLATPQSTPVKDFFKKLFLNVDVSFGVGKKVKNSIQSKFPTISKHVSTVATTSKNYLSTKPADEPTEDDTFFILRTIKQNLAQTKLFFKFCLDENMMRSQFGTMVNNEESGRSEVRHRGIIPKEASAAAQRTIVDFNKLLNLYGVKILSSAANTIYPTPSSLNFDILDLIKENIIEVLISKIDKNASDLFKAILDSFEKLSVEELNLNLNNVAQFCKDNIKLNQQENLQPLYMGFNQNQYEMFLNDLDVAATSAVAQTKNLELLMQRFTDDTSVKSELNNVKVNINNAIKNFFNEFENQYIGASAPVITSQLNINVNTVRNGIIPAYVKYITNCLYFYFLCALRDAICNSKFISTTEIQFERASSEVTDFPNYSLVLPLEIVLALHSVIMSRGWDNLIKTTTGNVARLKTADEIGREGIVSITDNYIKGIVKFVSMKLNIPNLFVIDSKKGDVYYKMMYQSFINKTKLNTFDTFVKSAINKPVSQNVYY